MENFVKEWLGVIMSGLALCTASWTLLQGPARKNEEALKGFMAAMTQALDNFKAATGEQMTVLDRRLDIAEANIGQLDTIVLQLPNKDAFHKLDKELTEVRGKIDTISVTVGSAEHSLQRIESFLINAAQRQG